jgi:hypothetical protein
MLAGAKAGGISSVLIVTAGCDAVATVLENVKAKVAAPHKTP